MEGGGIHKGRTPSIQPDLPFTLPPSLADLLAFPPLLLKASPCLSREMSSAPWQVYHDVTQTTPRECRVPVARRIALSSRSSPAPWCV